MSETPPFMYHKMEDGVVTSSSIRLTGDQRHAITHVFIHHDVISIRPQAFQACDRLVEVFFAQGLENICPGAFERCSALEHVSFPCTLQMIGKCAFRQCINLTELELPRHQQNGMRMTMDIDVKAFEGCRSLCAISFPENIANVGYQAFANCSSLLGVEIPSSGNDTATTINFGRNAFQGCHALVNVSIPMTMAKSRTERCFVMCSSLQSCCYPACDFPEALIDRYYRLPLHDLCYHASSGNTTHPLKDLHLLMDAYEKYDAVDRWGMTAYHILATSAKLRADWMMALMDRYPSQDMILKKDRNNKTMLDYLVLHKSNAAIIVFQKVLKRLLADGMECWGTEEWRLDILSLVELYGRQEVMARNHQTTPNRSNDDVGGYEMIESTTVTRGRCWEERMQLRHVSFDAVTRRLAAYGRKEVTSLMEHALWKAKIKSTTGMSRVDCRLSCGSDFVISQVMDYLWHDSEPSAGLMYLSL